MFGFPQQAQPPQGPWSGLPTAQAPWSGSRELWQPAQQAPWRLSPWSTQGMPQAAPIQPIAPMAQAPSPYLGQGTSAQLSGFNPMIPGGGFGATPAPAPTQQQAGGDFWWLPGAGGFADPTAAYRAHEQMGSPVTSPLQLSVQQAAEMNLIPGGQRNPIHPSYDPTAVAFGIPRSGFGV